MFEMVAKCILKKPCTRRRACDSPTLLAVLQLLLVLPLGADRVLLLRLLHQDLAQKVLIKIMFIGEKKSLWASANQNAGAPREPRSILAVTLLDIEPINKMICFPRTWEIRGLSQLQLQGTPISWVFNMIGWFLLVSQKPSKGPRNSGPTRLCHALRVHTGVLALPALVGIFPHRHRAAGAQRDLLSLRIHLSESPQDGGWAQPKP